MSHTNLSIFEIFMPPHNEKPEVVTFWRVRMKYKADGTSDTCNFQSVNVFKFIADDVDIVLWEHVCDNSQSGEDDEVLTEGTSLATMEAYEIEFLKKMNEV